MRVLARVSPTAEQLPTLPNDRPGFRLIRGAAGSGKTTTALMRLRQLCASRLNRRQRLRETRPVAVTVLTFNRTLKEYVEHLAEESATPASGLELRETAVVAYRPPG